MKLASAVLATVLTHIFITAVATAQPGAPGTAGYDKGFYLKGNDDRFALELTGRVQPFWTYTRAEGTSPSKTAFEIRRARLTLEGNIFGKDLLYKLQTDFGKGAVQLRDFHFDVRLRGDTWLRVGQWKRPFSRQHITSSGRLELTDRSIIDKAFDAGRDIGVALRNDYEKSPPIEWTVGVFNGTGIDPRQVGVLDPDTGEVAITNPTDVPGTFQPTVVGRIGVNEGGIKGYSEADLEGGPLRWAAGASVSIDGDLDRRDDARDKLELDYIVKAHGFSSNGGVYAMTRQAGAKPFRDQELGWLGMYAQAGYLVASRWQVAGRYSLVNVHEDGEPDVNQQELDLGVGYLRHGNDAKVQGAIRLLKSTGEDWGDTILIEISSNVGF
ncbi:MAG TPA: porin [Kofleriaceae bacterium]|jgi:hypothetical protein|nr:porin [Kofleriaceae bacterium]